MNRKATIIRNTRETKVRLELGLDEGPVYQINTPIGYFNHMLEQLAFHGRLTLNIECEGDVEVDCHHTVEDVGIALGAALLEALGEKKGLQRYAHAYVPMDETLARAVIDVSGRADFVFQADFTQERLGQLDTQMISHFFKSFAMNARLTLHQCVLYGSNDHHKCEGLFKSVARALAEAVRVDERMLDVTSTKGML